MCDVKFVHLSQRITHMTFYTITIIISIIILNTIIVIMSNMIGPVFYHKIALL